MRRVAIIGASGSGKTTLARAMAERLGVPHVELDSINHQAGWTEMPLDEFRARVGEIVTSDGWVIDSYYAFRLGDLIPEAADTIVWLDPPLPAMLSRLARRTAIRYVRRTELWNGNRETLRGVLWGRESLIWWAVARHGEYRRTLPAHFASPVYADTAIVRLRTPDEVEEWLRRVSPGPAA